MSSKHRGVDTVGCRKGMKIKTYLLSFGTEGTVQADLKKFTNTEGHCIKSSLACRSVFFSSYHTSKKEDERITFYDPSISHSLSYLSQQLCKGVQHPFVKKETEAWRG